MSLINEALKRAQAGTNQRPVALGSEEKASPFGAVAPARDGEAAGERLDLADRDDPSSALPPVLRTPAGRKPLGALPAFLTSTAVIVLGVWAAFLSIRGLERVRSADASSKVAPAAAQSPSTAVSRSAFKREGQGEGPPAAESTSPPAVIDASPFAVAETAQPSRPAGAANAIPLAAAIPPLTVAAPEPASPPLPAIPLPEPVQGVVPPAGQSPTNAPAAQTQPQSAQVDPSRFRLTSIMRIGGADTAMINGQLVQVGDRIDGATIVRIGSQSVELEQAGQRLAIRM